MSSEPSSRTVEVAVRLSPGAADRIRELIGLGLARSVEDYVADSVRNRLAGFQEIVGTGQPEGDPKDWVVPTRRI